MENLALFNNLYIIENPKFFDNGNVVEFRGVDGNDKNPIPGMFKLRCKRPPHVTIREFIEGFKSIERGNIVTACCVSEAYRSKFYGKQGKVVKASNGKWYYANRNRYHVRKIKRGANHPKVLLFALETIVGYVNELKARKEA